MEIHGKVKVFNVETKTSQSGKNYTTFNASFYKKNKDGDYENGSIRAVFFSDFQEIYEKESYYLVGRIEPNNYEKKGEKVYSFQLIAYQMHRIEKEEITPDDFFEEEDIVGDEDLPF